MQDNYSDIKNFIEQAKDYLKYFISNWKLILLIVIIFSISGLSYAFLKKPRFKAVFTFTLEDDKMGTGSLNGALGLASSLGLDLGSSSGGTFSGVNLIELMKSRRILEKTFLETIYFNGKSNVLGNVYTSLINLDKNLESKNYNKSQYRFSEFSKSEQLSILQDSVMMIICESILETNTLTVFQQDKKVSIITVELNSVDEIFSKLFAENLVKNISEFYIETKSKKARANVGILQKQADSIRNELNLAIAGVANNTDNTFNLNTALNIKRVPSTKRQVDVQANTAILTQLVTNLELAKVTLLKETPLIQVIDKPILPLKKKKVSKSLALLVGSFIGLFFSLTYLSLKKNY